MKKIVVTGGAGFIGSQLCEELLKRGNYVICVDNFFTGSMENIHHLRDHKYFEVLRHDITLPLFIECDQIYNLACPASPVHYQSDPIKTIKCNTVGVINILDLAQRTKSRVLQASTSEVYGNPLEHPQREDYWGNVNPLGIRSCYDEGKRVAEALCMDYHRKNNIDVKIVRIFNTYGPKMAVNDGRVVSNFIIQALKQKDITIYGTGTQTRSFQYVSDLIEGMIKMMERDNFIGPVNLGNPTEITILELAQRIIRLTGSDSQIKFKELPQDDPTRRNPNISLAKEKLDWVPVVEVDEGLSYAINFFRNKINNI